MRTGKTGKVSTYSHKKTCEIFWQAVSDNLHIRPFYVAKSQTKIVSPIRNFARISRVWWQGITAKPAKNYDKAQPGRDRCGDQSRARASEARVSCPRRTTSHELPLPQLAGSPRPPRQDARH